MSNIVLKGANSVQCLNCGEKWDLELPLEIKALVKKMQDIKDEHDKKCLKIKTTKEGDTK